MAAVASNRSSSAWPASPTCRSITIGRQKGSPHLVVEIGLEVGALAPIRSSQLLLAGDHISRATQFARHGMDLGGP